jgi:hypothetical protein
VLVAKLQNSEAKFVSSSDGGRADVYMMLGEGRFLVLGNRVFGDPRPVGDLGAACPDGDPAPSRVGRPQQTRIRAPKHQQYAYTPGSRRRRGSPGAHMTTYPSIQTQLPLRRV